MITLAGLLVGALFRGSVVLVAALAVSVPIVIVLLAASAAHYRKQRARPSR